LELCASIQVQCRLTWQDYKNLWVDENQETENVNNSNYQPFISFDGEKAKANNFVGFINCNDDSLEIYPKVFQNMLYPNKDLMHRHLFFWFVILTQVCQLTLLMIISQLLHPQQHL
jgi:5-methylcytosine-specific restriction endonuclease McrBC regulatory subunit McrC